MYLDRGSCSGEETSRGTDGCFEGTGIICVHDRISILQRVMSEGRVWLSTWPSTTGTAVCCRHQYIVNALFYRFSCNVLLFDFNVYELILDWSRSSREETSGGGDGGSEATGTFYFDGIIMQIRIPRLRASLPPRAPPFIESYRYDLYSCQHHCFRFRHHAKILICLLYSENKTHICRSKPTFKRRRK